MFCSRSSGVHIAGKYYFRAEAVVCLKLIFCKQFQTAHQYQTVQQRATATNMRKHTQIHTRHSTHTQMIEDLRDQCNEFVSESVVDVKVPRPYDPMLADQYIGIANYGKVCVCKHTHASVVS